MGNLLRAGFSRLLRSKAFWAIFAIFFALGAGIYCLNGMNLRQFGEGYFNRLYNYYLFFPILFEGGAGAVFSAFFVGSEFSFGTVRNKLIAGMNKLKIYLANFLMIYFALTAFFLAYILAAAVIGIPFFGLRTFTGTSEVLARVISIVSVNLAYSAIFTLIVMLIQDRAGSLVMGLVIFGIMFIPGILTYDRLSAPEYYTHYEIHQDGEMQEIITKNSNYPTPGQRRIYEAVEAFIPVGSGLEIISPEMNISATRTALSETALAVALTALGAAAFSRKNVK